MTELDLEAVKARHEQTIRSGWLGCDLQKAHEDRAVLISEVEALREAITPSGATKAAYIGEFRFFIDNPYDDEEDIEVDIPWTAIKEVMAMIARRARAVLPETEVEK